jgi:hypothetical protein
MIPFWIVPLIEKQKAIEELCDRKRRILTPRNLDCKSALLFFKIVFKIILICKQSIW